MLIKFLGTGPNNPITDKKGKSNRLQSSVLITHGDIKIMIDCTPSVQKQLKKIKPDYLLITHAHRDAAGGLRLIKNIKLLTTQKLYSELEKRYPVKQLQFVNISKIHKIDGFKIECFEVEHAKDFTTYGYRISFAGKKIVYASDFKIIPKKNEKYFKNTDVAIVDGAGWNFTVFGHQSIKGFLTLCKNWKIKKIYFTQIGRRVPNHEKAQKEIQKINKKAFLAWDGLALKIGGN
ncbi:MAG: MBL fold metallo-hydrolase [bacterium]